MSALMSAFARLPISISHGEGAYVWDTEGRRYLDALGGLAVTALGHAHPAITKAISDQAARLTHVSNLYGIPEQEQLAEKLCAVANMTNAFFCNSGAEANEAAIKMARLYGHGKGIDNPSIVVMEGAFHGRTLATLTATGNRKIQAGFEPLVSGFIRAPYSDIQALEQIAANQRDVVAVMLEPIQGEGGVKPCNQGYLSAVRQICNEMGWLMITDEIQCGMGRSGKWFASQHEGVTPDIMTVAKALGNGFPIGACLAHGVAADIIKPGTHGTTFGGNPMACRVALAVIEEIENNHLVERAGQLGQRLADGFRKTLSDQAGLVAIRGQGLMLGIELDRDCPELVGKALEAGVLLNVTAGRVIRMLPPYILSDEQADELVAVVSELIVNFLANSTDKTG